MKICNQILQDVLQSQVIVIFQPNETPCVAGIYNNQCYQVGISQQQLNGWADYLGINPSPCDPYYCFQYATGCSAPNLNVN